MLILHPGHTCLFLETVTIKSLGPRAEKNKYPENSIYKYIFKTVESLTTEQLEDWLCDFIEANKLENKPHSGRNSYFVVENEETTFPKEASLPSDNIFPEETSVPSPVLTDADTFFRTTD